MNMKLFRLFLGVILPPLGVLLTVGFGTTLFINVFLTLLGWFPGSIHAVWVIMKYSENMDEVVE